MSGQAFKIIEMSKQTQQTIKDCVTVMGTEALNHFTKSFRNQGFEDSGVQRWQPRKGEISGGIARARKRDKGSRAILIGKGTAHLMKSLRKHRLNKYSIMITSSGEQIKYANVHNEGLRSGRGKGFKMPQRKFVGDSAVLDAKIERMINRKLNQLWR